jgi:hypothetical protein
MAALPRSSQVQREIKGNINVRLKHFVKKADSSRGKAALGMTSLLNLGNKKGGLFLSA